MSTSNFHQLYDLARSKNVSVQDALDFAHKHRDTPLYQAQQTDDFTKLVAGVVVGTAAVGLVVASEVDDALVGIPSAVVGGAVGFAVDILDIF